jgi:hypothetical protein
MASRSARAARVGRQPTPRCRRSQERHTACPPRHKSPAPPLASTRSSPWTPSTPAPRPSPTRPRTRTQHRGHLDGSSLARAGFRAFRGCPMRCGTPHQRPSPLHRRRALSSDHARLRDLGMRGVSAGGLLAVIRVNEYADDEDQQKPQDRSAGGPQADPVGGPACWYGSTRLGSGQTTLVGEDDPRRRAHSGRVGPRRRTRWPAGLLAWRSWHPARRSSLRGGVPPLATDAPHRSVALCGCPCLVGRCHALALDHALDDVEATDARSETAQEESQGSLRQDRLKPSPEIAPDEAAQSAGDADRPAGAMEPWANVASRSRRALR